MVRKAPTAAGRNLEAVSMLSLPHRRALSYRHRASRWLPWLIALLALPAFAQDQPVRFAVARLPMSLPVHVAEARGLFAKHKVAVRVEDCDVGRQCLERLLAGGPQLATVADLPIALASLSMAPIRIVATLASNRNDTKLVARREAGIREVRDLPGKRVGMFPATGSEYHLAMMLLSHGLPPNSVQQVPIALDRSGRFPDGLDAVAVFEPFAYAYAQGLGERAVVIVDPTVYMLTWNIVTTTSARAPAERDVAAICRALAEAVDFIHQNPAAARRILADRLKLDARLVEWVWPDLRYEVSLRQSLIKGLEAEARWALRSRGEAGKPIPDFLEYIDSKPMEAAVPAAVTVVR